MIDSSGSSQERLERKFEGNLASVIGDFHETSTEREREREREKRARVPIVANIHKGGRIDYAPSLSRVPFALFCRPRPLLRGS